MSKVLRKRITIASTCSLSLYGGTFGPIRSPFYETIPNIARLICDGIEVYEETKNGKVRLTLSNFDKFEDDVKHVKVDESKQKQLAEQAARERAAKEARIKAEQEAKARVERENRERAERHMNQQKQKNHQQQQKPVVDNIVEE